MPRIFETLSLALLVVVAFCLVAAGPASVAHAGLSAAIRFVRAAQDGRTIDVYLDVKLIAPGIEWNNPTEYIPLQPGQHRVQVVPSGSDLSAAYSLDLQMEPNTIYTVAVIGQQPDLKLIAIGERPYVLPSGKAAMHIYHFSPDAPAIDLWPKIADKRSDKPLVSNLAFGNTSGYRELEPGMYVLEALPASVAVPSMGVQSFQAQPNVVYSMFIINSLSKQSQIIIPKPMADTPLPIQPVQLPKTGGQSAAGAAIGIYAILLLLCGLTLLLRARA